MTKAEKIGLAIILSTWILGLGYIAIMATIAVFYS